MLSSILSAQSYQDTFKRFPLCCLFAALFFSYVVSENHNFGLFDDAERFAVLFSGGFFIFGFFALLRESLNLSRVVTYILSFIAIIAFGVLVFLSSPFERHMFFIFPALLLLIMSAPFIFRKSSDTAFWHFNAVLWVNAKIGIVAALILGGGISAALAAIDFLFNVDINHRIYQDVWAFACIIFAPFYVFSQIPRDFNASVAIPAYEAILKFIVNWLLAPLVLIYLIILYAYFVKILFQWELPQGHLAAITTGFGGAGVLVYLVSWPFRDTGNKIVKLVHKYFFPALIVPTAMMCVSIIVRVQEYGLTEERYMIALTALWFAVIIVLTLLNRLKLRYIPIVLGAFMIIASFGPWGAISLSGTSQMHRLEALLIKNNLLQDGGIVPLSGDISFSDEKGINSILRYFQRRKELDMIQMTFPLKEGEWEKENVYSMLESMNLDQISEYMTQKRRIENKNQLSYNRDNRLKHFDIAGYQSFYHINRLYSSVVKIPEKKDDISLQNTPHLEIKQDRGIITVKVNAKDELKFDIPSYIEQYDFTNENRDRNKQEHIIELQSGAIKSKIILTNLQGRLNKDGSLKLNSVGFYLLLNMR